MRMNMRVMMRKRTHIFGGREDGKRAEKDAGGDLLELLEGVDTRITRKRKSDKLEM